MNRTNRRIVSSISDVMKYFILPGGAKAELFRCYPFEAEVFFRKEILTSQSMDQCMTLSVDSIRFIAALKQLDAGRDRYLEVRPDQRISPGGSRCEDVAAFRDETGLGVADVDPAGISFIY